MLIAALSVCEYNYTQYIASTAKEVPPAEALDKV